jgi:hypothetical protein
VNSLPDTIDWFGRSYNTLVRLNQRVNNIHDQHIKEKNSISVRYNFLVGNVAEIDEIKKRTDFFSRIILEGEATIKAMERGRLANDLHQMNSKIQPIIDLKTEIDDKILSLNQLKNKLKF